VKTITFRQLRHLWPVYLLVGPSLALILTFAYYPAVAAVKYAFYRWNGDDIAEWAGVDNFLRAFQDPVLGKAFVLVMIFITANLIKMVPSIVTAVVIHRLTSDRARYIYRVAFVIPMIIPGMVWLLLWKYFYNPQVGVLNRVLEASGLMRALDWLDTAMPVLSRLLTPFLAKTVDPVFGSLWGLGLAGAIILALTQGLRGIAKGWLWWVGLFVGIWFLWGPAASGAPAWGLTAEFWRQAVRHPGFSWGLLRIALLFGGLAAAAEVLRDHQKGRAALKWAGGLLLAAFALLVLTTAVWTEPIKAFGNPDAPPSWLGSPKLIPPAIIFWGFPWVGVISVLLYLSGLGNIDQSVYEAADIDGCGPIRKFWNIELPLIMTQIRLNLVLMIIGTLQGWGLVFILLGDTGGPGGVGMLPGLYMFRQAFTVAQVGYACAIGLLLFFLIVYLTVINNRYVRVSR
jgi:ABC-type sugar transport system permease subunit